MMLKFTHRNVDGVDPEVGDDQLDDDFLVPLQADLPQFVFWLRQEVVFQENEAEFFLLSRVGPEVFCSDELRSGPETRRRQRVEHGRVIVVAQVRDLDSISTNFKGTVSKSKAVLQ